MSVVSAVRGKILSILLELNDKDFFKAVVQARFEKAAKDLLPLIDCAHTLDDKRIDFAYDEYKQNVNQFTALLGSQDPDHYKRSGALLHALYKSEIVTGVDFTPDKDEIDSGFTRIQYADGQHTVTMIDFYEEFHNQLVAFDLAYDCCASYEDSPSDYDFDFLRNACFYLKNNSSLCLDTCFMFFRSLMQK
jgi:hypothetical protein